MSEPVGEPLTDWQRDFIAKATEDADKRTFVQMPRRHGRHALYEQLRQSYAEAEATVAERTKAFEEAMKNLPPEGDVAVYPIEQEWKVGDRVNVYPATLGDRAGFVVTPARNEKITSTERELAKVKAERDQALHDCLCTCSTSAQPRALTSKLSTWRSPR